MPAQPEPMPARRYAAGVQSMDDVPAGADAERPVEFDDDAPAVLPDQSTDDTDHGWGENSWSNDDRLLADRPPHW